MAVPSVTFHTRIVGRAVAAPLTNVNAGAKRASEQKARQGRRSLEIHDNDPRRAMNIALWMLAGGFLGWAGHEFLRLNIERGRMISIVIGAAGGVLGGKFIAPMFAAAALPGAVPDGISMSSMLFAMAVAVTFIAVANLVSNRWDI
jgi:uncharacterized membrane protein YeaQ/YmgE (transglycosylase-associated protein family)